MDDRTNYYPTSREERHGFYYDGKAPSTGAELDNIKSADDQTSLRDVQETYVPLMHPIRLHMKEFESLTLSKGLSLREYVSAPPFTIGTAGNVTVGKGTTARLLQRILARALKRRNVQLVTTDEFSYPNKVLGEQGVMDRKGFPESYDTEKSINFLNEVKSGKNETKAPVYSHSVYDVIEDEYGLIQQPDILIIEGINTLQLLASQRVYVSDFFNFFVLMDTDSVLIERWYLEHFEALLDTAFLDPNNYYY